MTPDQARTASSQAESEAELDRAAFGPTKDGTSWAELGGWWTYHARNPQEDEPGMFDRLAIRPPVILFAELKSEEGYQRWLRSKTKTETAQHRVLDLLLRCTEIRAEVWRPGTRDEHRRTLLAGTPYATDD